MKYKMFLILLLASSCGGSLTTEQRKKIRESIEQGQIKKVSEAEISEAAFSLGISIADFLIQKDPGLTNRTRIDSVGERHQVKIVFLSAADSLSNIEKQIIEAYEEGVGHNPAVDNIQKIGNDSILFTRPIIKSVNGISAFEKALAIRMSKKQIVLSIKE